MDFSAFPGPALYIILAALIVSRLPAFLRDWLRFRRDLDDSARIGRENGP